MASVETILGHPVDLFGAAVLHVLVAGKAKRWFLLFGYVELLPREVPPPLHDGVIEGPHLRKSGLRVYADHVPVTVDRGIQWYRDARSGRTVRPARDGAVPLVDNADAVICESNQWDQEPTWPGFIAAASPRALPFLSRWHQTPRTHHLISSIATWPFQPDELAELDDFFEKEAGFRRTEFPQLLGSVHLIAPNPYYRSLHELLAEPTEGPVPRANADEAITVYVDPRTGVTLPALNIELTEHRPVGIAQSVSTSLTATPTRVSMRGALRRTSSSVKLNSDGSLLEVRDPTPFMRQFHLTMDVSSTKRTVQVVDATGTVQETYQVSVAHPSMSQVGTRPPSAGADSFETMLHEVAVRDSARDLDQHWFAGDPVAARDFVRQLIQRARQQVLVADPFFSGLEVQRFALATTVANVGVRMLTTREGFPSNGLSAARLAANIARWQSTEPSLGKLELRVMDRNELHDRFLRVDDRVYTLGNSLNSIGDKASLLIRVPDPKPVILQLEQMWNDATPLDAFVSAAGSSR